MELTSDVNEEEEEEEKGQAPPAQNTRAGAKGKAEAKKGGRRKPKLYSQNIKYLRVKTIAIVALCENAPRTQPLTLMGSEAWRGIGALVHQSQHQTKT